MSHAFAYCCKSIFDGDTYHDDAALLVTDGVVKDIAPRDSIPDGYHTVHVNGELIAPGFVDLQVNGGGGALLNEQPTLDSIKTICAAHAQFGTTSLLPTLITDRPEIRDQAIEAGIAANEASVPGFLGLHLEGPHLSLPRKGAHDADLIRPMDDADLAALTKAIEKLPHGLTTIAPENVSRDQVTSLANAGWSVSLGHTDCTSATAMDYFAAGASFATHLFNAMSQLANREPGLVGATLAAGSVSCGLIADCVHVDPITIQVAMRAKQEPGHIFFVTDAMSCTGTDQTEFKLNGRTILRRDGRLTLSDGTLAGADIDMISMVRLAVSKLGIEQDEALKLASHYPAKALGADKKGGLKAGMDADFLTLTSDLSLRSTWIGGECVFES